MAKKTDTSKLNSIAKAMKEYSSKEIIETELSLGEGIEGVRWELYRGNTPFWVVLLKLAEKTELVSVYGVMFGLPTKMEKDRKLELFQRLLELNDFSISMESKFFFKESTVFLACSQTNYDIPKESVQILIENFMHFAVSMSSQVLKEFPEIMELLKKQAEQAIDLNKENKSG